MVLQTPIPLPETGLRKGETLSDLAAAALPPPPSPPAAAATEKTRKNPGVCTEETRGGLPERNRWRHRLLFLGRRRRGGGREG